MHYKPTGYMQMILMPVQGALFVKLRDAIMNQVSTDLASQERVGRMMDAAAIQSAGGP